MLVNKPSIYRYIATAVFGTREISSYPNSIPPHINQHSHHIHRYHSKYNSWQYEDKWNNIFIYIVYPFASFPPLAFYCLPEQIKLLPKVGPFFCRFFVGADFLAPLAHTTFCHTERYIEIYFVIWMKCVKWKPKVKIWGLEFALPQKHRPTNRMLQNGDGSGYALWVRAYI